MTTSYSDEVTAYFKVKADGYDRVDEQVYWRLSDELLWEALLRYVLPSVPVGATMLDAGGGTGRWTDRLLRHRPDMTGVLYDLSPDMTRHARAKSVEHGYADRLTVRQGDLADLSEHVDDGQFDLIISFHNVLGFVTDVPSVLRQFANALKPGGQTALVVPNRYHAVYFNVLTGALNEAERAAVAHSTRFAPEMPVMKVFTPTQLTGTLNEIGLPVTTSTGFPVAVYPGFQETQLDGSSGVVKAVFADDAVYAQIKSLELRLLGEPGLAERGNNLFVVAGKPR
ncbi:tRNA 5-carboxymethoxyuridine methyltransferase [Lentzea pudingi]|uniref:tRNA 5-carboxymethoxyuridine methyltransferase n=1 Tax=Lentzea pudingi TaxID=1789439 RepID=A0ABQ2IT29_9PSEU|nr:class I SAM-dependent methyltransferase [Lentzea pudingi]GGN29499.1 tRNA 5-carboxymethoxyuridine methyltransferase [Lentzea pudingi]